MSIFFLSRLIYAKLCRFFSQELHCPEKMTFQRFPCQSKKKLVAFTTSLSVQPFFPLLLLLQSEPVSVIGNDSNNQVKCCRVEKKELSLKKKAIIFFLVRFSLNLPHHQLLFTPFQRARKPYFFAQNFFWGGGERERGRVCELNYGVSEQKKVLKKTVSSERFWRGVQKKNQLPKPQLWP